ncbi:hypothetical protein LRS03_05270 [Rhizobacter sp. J219]|uniref:hypothetical protein n=1 Tax=Rhizobacter sp. J219 TaxID=2898430 RepID=UPI002151DCE6|nr:hypothetical protein [Rhizobacter sp. J219]MCR5882300.1 hypothetical protein [Rhizobacter sp. J219]
MSLQLSLALAQQLLDRAPAVPPRDPYAIDLPSLQGSGPSAILPDTMRALGALYLDAELEQAGLPYAAELLAEHRFELPLQDAGAARALERFSHLRREHLNRQQRDSLYARLFGLGAAAGEGGSNNDFQRCLAALAQAVLRQAEPPLYGGSVAMRDSAVRWAAQQLEANLAARPYGNAVAAGSRLQLYLREAIAVLQQPGLLRQFAVTGLWPLLAKLFGANSPDLGRFVARGQNGLQLLQQLADWIPLLHHKQTPLPAASAAAQAAAAQWLMASGLVPRQ